MEIPFTDGSGSKRRPAAVVSSSDHLRAGADVIVVPITSINQRGRFGTVPVGDWRSSGLAMESWIKGVLATVERRRLIRRLGHLDTSTEGALRTAVHGLIG